jgi:hypothetical protein
MPPNSSGWGFNRGISSSIKLLEISLPGLSRAHACSIPNPAAPASNWSSEGDNQPLQRRGWKDMERLEQGGSP